MAGYLHAAGWKEGTMLRACFIVRMVIVAGMLLLTSAFATLGQTFNPNAMVRIEVEDIRPDGSAIVISAGSGAVIDRKGFVMTARHVVEEALKQGSGLKVYGRLRSKDGVERYPLDLVGYGLGEADIALLQFPTGVKDEWGFLPLDTNDLAVQERITGWGFPIDQDLQPIGGQVTLQDALIVRVNANFIFGMSGGPVLDQQGRVRGVIKGGSIIPGSGERNQNGGVIPGTELLAPGLTFIVPLRLARSLIDVFASQAEPLVPQITVTYRVCSGEHEKACPAHDIYFYCYTNISKWAEDRCESFVAQRLQTYGGNKCGYSIDNVICTGPK
ncbi:serine protease [Mesorhizobium sp. M0898]|uniref:S1 family peptidase n=1 Tax=Mesorhizobium sp. M0898 TaxID=2957020 RepID=UPI0033396E7C